MYNQTKNNKNNSKHAFATDIQQIPGLPEQSIVIRVTKCESNPENNVFSGILQAKNRVRELIQEGLEPGGIKVIISAGEYELENELIFDEKDSGTQLAPIMWEADGKVLLSGGKKLEENKFRLANSTDEMYKFLKNPQNTKVYEFNDKLFNDTSFQGGYGMAYAGESKITDSMPGNACMFPEVFVNNAPAKLARFPADGYLRVAEGQFDNTITEKPDSICFTYDEEALDHISKTDGIFLNGYFMFDWAFACVALSNIDKINHTLTSKDHVLYGVRKGMRYFLSNVIEHLEQPGEWYIDYINKKLYYIFLEDIKNNVYISLLKTPIIRLNNASHISFTGFDFAYGRCGAINVEEGESLRFSGCKFYNLGINAISFGTRNCCNGGKNSIVESCDIYNTGFGGIYINAGDRNSLTPCNIQVRNCDIYNFARIGKSYHPAININGCGSIIANNRMHDEVHSAIIFAGNENVIEYNEFYRLVSESDDAAAVYCGRDYAAGGNVIRYNFFHSMKSNAKTECSVFGTYCDDNSANLAYYGNIYYKMQGAHLSHGGHDIIFENNLIVDKTDNSRHSVVFHRYGYTFTLEGEGEHLQNLAKVKWDSPLWKQRYPHIREYLSWDPHTIQCYPHFCSYSNNVIVRHLPFNIDFDGKDHLIEQYGNKMENNYFTETDIELKDAENFDFSFGKDSSVFQHIPFFELIPFNKIGLYYSPFRENI